MADNQLCGNVILTAAFRFILIRSDVAVVEVFECGHFLTVLSKHNNIPQVALNVWFFSILHKAVWTFVYFRCNLCGTEYALLFSKSNRQTLEIYFVFLYNIINRY